MSGNSAAEWGKWRPYYHKSFNLGNVQNEVSTAGEDGVVYVSSDSGNSGNCNVYARQTSDINSGYSYKITITTITGTDNWWIDKYLGNDFTSDQLVERIYASDTTGNGRYHYLSLGWHSMDLGIEININGNSDDGDIHYIKTAPKSEMDKKKKWFDGVSTFMPIPPVEGDIYHSEPIPIPNFSEKGVTVALNIGVEATDDYENGALLAIRSKEAATGNYRMDIGFSSSNITGGRLPKDVNYRVGLHNTNVRTTNQLTLLGDDLNLISLADTANIVCVAPYRDVTATLNVTGTAKTYDNQTHARMRNRRLYFGFHDSSSSSAIGANNQYWQVFVMNS